MLEDLELKFGAFDFIVDEETEEAVVKDGMKVVD